MTDLRTPEQIGPDEIVAEEDMVPADDRIIGRAFRWSLLVFAVIGASIALMVWAFSRPQTVMLPEARAFVPPRSIEVPAVAPVVKFTDITSEAGVDFTHFNGATGDKLLPETMGGGCAFFDYDSDGDQDILLINSANWPEAPDSTRAPSSAPTHALYQNDGAGRFTNVTQGSGLDTSFYGIGAACGDYDNDGDTDVFISAVGPDHLLQNNGGHFNDVTAAAGVAGAHDAWGAGAGFFDYDNDADLDLFVCNYVKWSRDIDFAVNFTLTGVGRAYGPPTNFEGQQCALYRNDGDGSFTDVSEPAGIHRNNILGRPMGKALGLALFDVDADGWMDIFVANDTVQRFLFHNNRDGTFTEQAEQLGMAFDRDGRATGAMGVDSARYRNDETVGVVIGNFANEMSSLLVANDGSAQFTDEAITEGIGAPTRSKLTFGAFFFDYDLDGRLDLLQANGHIEDEINIVQPSQQYRQPAQLFWNAGPDAKACFVEADGRTVGDLAHPIVGRGAAYADIDGDGDLDVLLTQISGPPMLLRNELEKPHHWLRLRLIGDGVKVNRDAIGVRVDLTSGGVTQTRFVMPTRSYLSQVELPVTFGLGENAIISAVTITWPDGSSQRIENPGIDRLMVVQHESPGTAVPGL